VQKVPSLDEIIRNPKLTEKLTLPQLKKVVERVQSEARGYGKKTIPRNPADFAAKLSSGTWVHARHLDLLSKKLAALERREIRRLMVSMPPRYGKSFLVNTYFPLWWLTLHPFDRIILAGYGETFARKWGGDVRDLIIEHSEELNLVIDRESTAADDWNLTRGGGMLCVGVGGALMGRGANVLIIDDPIKNDLEANSQTYRDRLWDWWQASASTRLEPNGVVVIVATRWHEDDLLGRIERDHAEDWEIVKIPAIAEADDILGRYEGEPLWPERFTGPDSPVEIKKRSSPYWFSAMFQQRPSPPGGGLLGRDDWQFYHTKPARFDQMIQAWDFALKDKATSDYTVGQVWGRAGADLYLIEQIRGHLDLATIERHMKSWTIKYQQATAKIFEDTALGPAVKQRLQHEVPGIIPIPVKGTSKRSRAENVIPYLQGHNLYLPERQDGSKERWVWDFIEECAQFPRATHDDQVDALGYAVAYLQPATWRDLKEKAAEAAEADPSNVMSPREVRSAWFNEKLKRAGQKFARRHGAGPHPIYRRGLW
jgi:predicted phage terminase large subunit-like protein